MKKILIFLLCIIPSLGVAIEAHKTNYLVMGRQVSSDYSYIKYQVSLKHKLSGAFHFGYTQKSFWDIQAASSPFRESIYNPEIFFEINNYFTIGHEHESTGVAGWQSRSWERTYAIIKGQIGPLLIGGKVYHAWPYYLFENSDIINYAGNYEFFTGLSFHDKFVISSTLKERSLQVEAFYNAGTFNLYAQAFRGYDESLVWYFVETNSIYYGLSFSY